MWAVLRACLQHKSLHCVFIDTNQVFIVSLDLLIAKADVLGFEDLPVR